MPYLTCSRCGHTTYAVRPYSTPAACPHCDAPLPTRDAAPGVAVAHRSPASVNGEDRITRSLALARTELDMDVALLTEIVDGRETALHVDGGWSSLASLKGGSLPLEDTFCGRLLDGRISSVVADARRDERVRDVKARIDFDVGAYIGVPLEPADARLYVLCCLAREARPELSEVDVRFLRGLGETLIGALDEPTD